MNVVTHKDKKALLLKAAADLQSFFLKNTHASILFLSSGGSSFELLNYLDSIPLNLSVGVVDERYSTDPAINNFAQFEKTEFFKKYELQFKSILDTKVQNEESLEEFARRYEELLRNWKTANPEGIIVTTLGVGPDGHISGINPSKRSDFDSLFVNTDKWVVSYESSLVPPMRATTTFPFLRQIDYAVSVVTGENKKDALSKIMKKNGSLSETPGRILRELKIANLFTDIDVS